MKPKRSMTSSINKTTNRLRLLLGDQLDIQHAWFKEKNPQTVYLIAELKQETDYTTHHVQKVCAFFSAMEQFSIQLASDGHQVLHLTLDETHEYSKIEDLLLKLMYHHKIEYFDYQRPDEYRLFHQLSQFRPKNVAVEMCESNHFVLAFDDIKKEFKPYKASKMEFFYRRVRKRLNILMEGDQPLGGKWNYDAENRSALKPNDLKAIPPPKLFNNDVSKIRDRISQYGIKTIGQSVDQLIWPVNRKQSLELLDYFCQHLLPQFGRFQDAMTDKSAYQWSLYHSRISFALNAKLMSPLEVVNTAIEYWDAHQDQITLPQIEGFVRQIIGWREFIRGIYWANMPQYGAHNHLDAKRKLPTFFWSGETKMNCLHQAISQSLDYAYAHHIQRLMITGNFCLLAGIDPDEVDQWYMGIYVDAIEWVEMPNTRGMTQFADGGLVATKPYAASGSYVNKMSDYCKSCHYNVKNRTEEDACPLNSLYWNFISQHEQRFKSNPRMAMVYRSWNKMDQDKKEALLTRAQNIIKILESV